MRPEICVLVQFEQGVVVAAVLPVDVDGTDWWELVAVDACIVDVLPEEVCAAVVDAEVDVAIDTGVVAVDVIG